MIKKKGEDLTLDAVTSARRAWKKAEADFHAAIVRAFEAKPVHGRKAEIAGAAGFSDSRVRQILNDAAKADRDKGQAA
ncbi:hypothetical protein [Streptomyces griseocarneus]|uniref:hypothetical protein n=1 Tax=Streptomyces griseocarneus TaxID=51201 RepID=UPI00167D316C|nr:hypothetical protein [Streptomyces griseocarneus]MBZ6475064.1 hypothetical protein [Streptomyces griseocarneus]GHG62464.1 hypothetical protein GCM10018779_31180 [Streptomyces griseocarneus]